MKYLITESQKEDSIKKFILSNFDRVEDVWFTTKSVYYGSRPVNGKNRGDVITINVLVDNTSEDDYLGKVDLVQLKNKIIRQTDKLFGLNYDRYGGGWNFSFNKKVIEKF